MHQSGVNGIVSFSKSQTFKNPSHFRDLSDMYTHLLASCAASRERLKAFEKVIENEMISFSDLVAEDDAALGRKPVQQQETEDNDDEEVLIIEQPTETIEVPDEEDDDCELPEDTEYIIADDVSSMQDIATVINKEGPAPVKTEDVPAVVKTEQATAIVKTEDVPMDMPSTSGQKVEVFEGFTIKSFEPEAVPEFEDIEVECKPDISVKEEPTFAEIEEVPKAQLKPKILRPKVNPLRPMPSRIDKLHENLRQKLKRATKPLTHFEYLRTYNKTES